MQVKVAPVVDSALALRSTTTGFSYLILTTIQTDSGMLLGKKSIVDKLGEQLIL
jgi:hypothetical protein